MRIEKIHYVRARVPLRSRQENQDVIFLGVESEGVAGWGETAPLSEELDALVLDFKRNLIPFALQTPFDKIEDLNHLLSVMKTGPEARAGLEMAVWDLFSNRDENFLSEQFPPTEANVPLARILDPEQAGKGGKNSNLLVLKITPENLDSVLKIWRRDFPKTSVILDAQGLFSEQNADQLTALADFPVRILLDPFPAEEWRKLEQWKSVWKVPVGVLRPVSDILTLEKICQSNLVDWVIVDPWRAAGLHNTIRFLKMSKRHGLWAGVLSENHTMLGLFWAQLLANRLPEISLLLATLPEETFEINWKVPENGSSLRKHFVSFFEMLAPWVVEKEEFW